MAALRTLSKKHNQDLKVWKILARTHAEMLVTPSDSEQLVGDQWERMCTHLEARDTAMIYHLENHYSIIYAMREWDTHGNVRDGVQCRSRVRQILVGKPGQAPNTWIDWEDVRACLLGWKGYGVVCAQCKTKHMEETSIQQ